MKACTVYFNIHYHKMFYDVYCQGCSKSIFTQKYGEIHKKGGLYSFRRPRNILAAVINPKTTSASSASLDLDKRSSVDFFDYMYYSINSAL